MVVGWTQRSSWNLSSYLCGRYKNQINYCNKVTYFISKVALILNLLFRWMNHWSGMQTYLVKLKWILQFNLKDASILRNFIFIFIQNLSFSNEFDTFTRKQRMKTSNPESQITMNNCFKEGRRHRKYARSILSIFNKGKF